VLYEEASRFYSMKCLARLGRVREAKRRLRRFVQQPVAKVFVGPKSSEKLPRKEGEAGDIAVYRRCSPTPRGDFAAD